MNALPSWSDADVYSLSKDLQKEKYRRELALVHAQLVDDLKMMRRTEAFADVKVEKNFTVWDTSVTVSREQDNYTVTIVCRGKSVCGTCTVLKEPQENPRYNIQVTIPSYRVRDEVTDVKLAMYTSFEDAFVKNT